MGIRGSKRELLQHSIFVEKKTSAELRKRMDIEEIVF